MKLSYSLRLVIFCVFISTLFAVWGTGVLAAPVTITGEVNDNYQIVADGQIYEIADTAEGNELAENYISIVVKVTGTIEEVDDMKVITVISYEVVPE